MAFIAIPGLTKLVNIVRWRLHGPLSFNRWDRLQPIVRKGIQQVESVLAERGATAEVLAPRTRLAYEFFQRLDSGPICGSTVEDADAVADRTVRFGSLMRNWKEILDALGQPEASGNVDACFAQIRLLSQAVEDQLREDAFRINEVPSRIRAIRGWLSYFSDKARFVGYVKAVARARPVWASFLPVSGEVSAPITFHFRPTRRLCKILRMRTGCRVVLPTPMIQFTEREFGYLASVCTQNAGSKHKLLDAIEEIAYVRIEDGIQLLAGAEDEAARGHHDLIASFERVTQQNFKGAIVRPRLVWSIEPAKVLFSCYDRVHNTLVITRRMDRPEKSPAVIDLLIEDALLRASLWPRIQCIPEVSAEE